MRRRDFIGTLGGLAAAWPALSSAQQPNRIARVGRLSPLSITGERAMLEALRSGLAEHGWVEGQNMAWEIRLAEGQVDRLPALAAELVAKHVDVIVVGAHAGAMAAKNATSKIPIVMVTTGDPIKFGLVASLARPGGNVTGVTTLGQALNVKCLEVLREAVPAMKRVAVLINPASNYIDTSEVIEASRTFGLEAELVKAGGLSDLESAFATISRIHVDALMVIPDPVFISIHPQIVALTLRSRLPSIFGDRQSVRAGGLIFYGASLEAMYRRAAVFVDKILRGGKPADIPVEQPTQFDLAINLRTASVLGLSIPSSLLARADEVLE